jgi:hypothetical protein
MTKHKQTTFGNEYEKSFESDECNDDEGGGKKESLSQKQKVIESLFRDRYCDRRGPLPNPVVYYNPLRQKLTELRCTICKTNSANFFYFNSVRQANAAWPPSVFSAGYTGVARIGDNRCFEFIPVPPGHAIHSGSGAR